MNVQIKRIDNTLPLPKYETTGAAGFDIYARESITIAPQEVIRIPTNLVIATPPGYMLAVSLRSSAPKKKVISIPHGYGIIDSDYCGNDDEILLQVINHTTTPVQIEKGERIGQGVFIPITQATWEEVNTMSANNRGGFGTTG